MSEAHQPYQTKSAVLFIIFNRPDTTEQVFDKIKIAQPPRLYIAADGPRDSRPDENELCRQARQIATQVDWPCEIKTLFREKNYGCKEAVSSAITWFFDNEEEGIILEDDCLPANSFFRFCDELLKKYRNDDQIRHISGGNFQHGKKWGDASYYFGHLTHIWGWASWRRAWKDYDKQLSAYNETDVQETFTSLYHDNFVTQKWVHIFNEVKAGKIDTWDYQLILLNFLKRGVCILPNINMIANIGFGNNATHTISTDNPWANMPLIEMDNNIIHPKSMVIETQADIYTLKKEGSINDKPNLLAKTFKRWRRSISKRMNKK